MLDEIVVHNLGLIQEANVQLAEGLTVITGETGTGKTLMLGALRLLRGDKAGKGIIGPASASCDVSGRLIEGDSETTIRRTVDASRSRAYIDGAAATAGTLSETLAGVVAIVGQHDQLTITTSAGVRTLIDRLLDEEGSRAAQRYAQAWGAYRAVLDEADEIGGDLHSLERERDTLAFQIAEIDDAAIDPETDGDLRQRVIRLRNVDALTGDIGRALHALGDDGAEAHLDAAIAALDGASKIDPEVRALSERLIDATSSLREATSDIAAFGTGLEADPSALESLEDRIALINGLMRKYGDSIEDIAVFQKQAGERHDRLTALLEASADIEQRIEAAAAEVAGAGSDLTAARRRAAISMAVDATGHLRDLGFTSPVVAIDIEASEPNRHGCDTASVQWASTEGLTPQPVSAIASGGELSRLVLALTLASGSAEATVLAFDEIDTGIGGATALAMGQKLNALAEHRQVVVVSHLPQVAAFADEHIVVDREGADATVRRLDDEERLVELTRMLSGMSESVVGREHAAELVALARRSE